MPPNTDLYEQDFYAWTQQQAALLRGGKVHELDLANLAEEIESVGRSDKRELGNRLELIVMHLLKWCYQPEGHQESHSWEDTIWEQRRQVAGILEDSPSLRREVSGRLERHYPAARRKALRDTRLPEAVLPQACPWTPEQILDEDFWPESPTA